MALTAEDEDVRLLGEVAVVTFHLPAPWHGRRTFVLQRDRQAWHIVHLHASNLPPAA